MVAHVPFRWLKLLWLLIAAPGVGAAAGVPAAVASAIEPRTTTGANTGVASPAPSVQQEFVAAMNRVRLRLPEPPDSPALQAYVIHDYLVAARLRQDLLRNPGEELDGTIDGFLQTRGSAPVTRALRREWLMSLAQRERWDWFLPRSRDVSDPQLACERLHGLRVTGQTLALAAPALARWSLAQQAPPACDDVFAWLRAQQLLTPERAEARVRAALAAENPRLAREFAADLSPAQAALLLPSVELLERPQDALGELARHPDARVEPDILVAAFTHLARINSQAATALLPPLLARPQMTAELQTRLRRAAALGAAYDHDPRAVSDFATFVAEPDDESVQEWRARAALWAGNFQQAQAWILQMAPALASEPRWRYWLARSVAATAGEAAALPLFTELAGLRDYYGYLAADRLHQNYSLNARATPDDLAVESALAAAPGLQRAHALFDCDETEDAAAEWTEVVGNRDAATKVQAARLAAGWGWYSQSIATLAQSGDFDDVRLRYPRPYPASVAAASELSHVPGDWIFAVMRQESLFRADAVSRANARGLMQLLPATADAVARRWHLPQPPANGLFDPPVAITLGAVHLRELLDRYSGQLELSLAAYNAGVSPVARWQPPAPMDADIWIENIPYNETRSYVQHILEHIVAFAWVRGGELPQLSTLLHPVGEATAPVRLGQASRTP